MNEILAFHDDRVLQRYRPGVWIGAVRRVIAPVANAASERNLFESRPPHYLIALWKPLRLDQPVLPRWPRKATLVAPDEAAAVAELLRELPRSEQLWLTQKDIDWCLIAEIVKLSESRLQPHELDGLQQFLHGERAATLAAIRENYHDAEGPPVTEAEAAFGRVM